ncbi:hypothetical protein IHQ56_14315 [Methylobacillus flagellatus]|uniref:hypothetical protein n=1 Tax=Methylobacillus flagellatus TaxID=405 RepID=UPI002853AEF2|nr:hypothetical protein [Methylobacillus flagellatus]MDR5172983.1 hypothetical protein [Methylobacillus flagellatus]
MMGETSVLLVKPGSVTFEDKAACREVGVVVIEMEDPASAKFLRPAGEVSHSDMLACAARAMSISSGVLESFGRQVANAVIAAHNATPPRLAEEAKDEP